MRKILCLFLVLQSSVVMAAETSELVQEENHEYAGCWAVTDTMLLYTWLQSGLPDVAEEEFNLLLQSQQCFTVSLPPGLMPEESPGRQKGYLPLEVYINNEPKKLYIILIPE